MQLLPLDKFFANEPQLLFSMVDRNSVRIMWVVLVSELQDITCLQRTPRDVSLESGTDDLGVADEHTWRLTFCFVSWHVRET